MTHPLNKLPRNGPLSQPIALLHHLQSLLENLPKNLPLDPMPSHYSFRLDYETIGKEGVWFAFNQNMEVNFKTQQIPGSGNESIVLREWDHAKFPDICNIVPAPLSILINLNIQLIIKLAIKVGIIQEVTDNHIRVVVPDLILVVLPGC